jgi:hypothetical protein
MAGWADAAIPPVGPTDVGAIAPQTASDLL